MVDQNWLMEDQILLMVDQFAYRRPENVFKRTGFPLVDECLLKV